MKTNATVNSKLWSVYKDHVVTMKKIDGCVTPMVRACYVLMKNVKAEIENARTSGNTNYLKFYITNVVRPSIRRDYVAHPSVATKYAIDFCDRAIAAL